MLIKSLITHSKPQSSITLRLSIAGAFTVPKRVRVERDKTKEISDNFRKEDDLGDKVETGCRDIGSRDGIAIFREAQEKGTLCKMQNRSDKRNPITRKPKEHFPTIKKYTLKTGN